VSINTGGYAFTGTMVPDSVAHMVLVRTDEGGNQLTGSPKVYGGAYHTTGIAILELDDGFLLGGNFFDTTATNTLQTDIYIVRTDAEGNELWSKRYGNGENQLLNHMTTRKGGGFMLAGQKTNAGQEDIWLLMIDDEGNKEYEFPNSAHEGSGQAEYLLSVPGGYLCASTYDDGSLAGMDITVTLMDEECSPAGSIVFGTEEDDYARALIPFEDGYLVAGYAVSSTGYNVVRLYRFDISGGRLTNPSSFATISESGADLTCEGMIKNTKGQVAIIGSREVNENRDMMLMLVNSDGTFYSGDDGIPGLVFGNLGNQTGKAIDNAADGGLIFTGNNSYEGNSLIALVKTTAKGTQ